jgi:formamidopyrimidine-DNA glycosylase
MPELPDIAVYVEALRERILGKRLERLRIVSPFLLRTAQPAPADAVGLRVRELRRLGKRIAVGFEADLWFVFHLMIAGRFHWREEWPAKTGRLTAALFAFASGTLELTEAGTKKRASLHVVRGTDQLDAHDQGGLEVATADARAFRAALLRENHTLKRALTDPRIFSGIGNAYSDEILHRARLSPVMLTSKLAADESTRLFEAAQAVLSEWTERLRRENRGRFPAKVTAFHAAMAVHGRFGSACPVCATKIQRIRYSTNETNYCPRCQTGGRLLADRALSRLLKQDWPRSVEELEKLRSPRSAS